MGDREPVLRVLIVAAALPEPERAPLVAGPGVVVREVTEADAALSVVASFRPQLVLIDTSLPNRVPAPLIAQIREAHACVCALLAPIADGQSLTLAAQSGADAVLLRPIDPATLRRIVRQESRPSTTEPLANRGAELPSVVVGASPEMHAMWRLVMLAAESSSSVVITGETGTGKEVVARALHRFSARRSGPFVAVNCAALPDALLESELFGHERGAFTGAAARRKGRFELADGGTLLLDEIGDLPLGLQVKLLRVLQERSFERLGGTDSVTVDVRVIAATHKNLEEEVRLGRFRGDLFYRLNVLSIHVPPLRERKGDILGLWRHLIDETALSEGRDPPHTSEAVYRLLLRHDWPGNIRELHNVALRALTLAGSEIISVEHLPNGMRAATEGAERRLGLAGMTMAEVERAAILDTYRAVGRVKATAEMLGVSERKIHYRLRQFEKDGRVAQRSRRSAAIEAGALDRAQRPPRILLAEDDDEVRWSLAEFLKSVGYEVLAVSDGRRLMERLDGEVEAGAPDASTDIIITDLRMPGLTGLQLLENVRLRAAGTPVVLISAFGDADIRSRATSLGAAAFLDKPIDVGELHRVLQAATGSGLQALQAHP